MEDPSYYAIIPANVRYDKRLKANEKLMYGEITSLTSKFGYCFASNKYFADLYDVSLNSISSWIGKLIKCGYITSEIKYKPGTKEIDKRYIRLFVHPTQEIFDTPTQEKCEDNSTSSNNTSLIDFNKLKAYFNKVFNKNCKVINPDIRTAFNKRLKEGYSKEDILKVIDNCSHDKHHVDLDYKYVSLKFLSKPDIFERYASQVHKKPLKIIQEQQNSGDIFNNQ